MRSRIPTAAAMLLGGSLVGGWSLTGAFETAGLDQPTPFHATALCHDGTWSWNKHPDGPTVCANHGGVAEITGGGAN